MHRLLLGEVSYYKCSADTVHGANVETQESPLAFAFSKEAAILAPENSVVF